MPADLLAARETAAALLLEQRIYTLSYDITHFRYRQAVCFDTMQNFCRRSQATLGQLLRHSDMRDGCTIVTRREGKPFYLVLYNEDSANPRRRAFTLAHEVGHILLNHAQDAPEQEEEANCFAAEVLLPRILLRELQKRSTAPLTPEQLLEIFPVSLQMARVGLTRLAGIRDADFSSAELALLAKLTGLLPDPAGPVVDI